MTTRHVPDTPEWDELVTHTVWAFLAAGEDVEQARSVVSDAFQHVSMFPAHIGEFMAQMLCNSTQALYKVLLSYPDGAQWRLAFQMYADLGHLDWDVTDAEKK